MNLTDEVKRKPPSREKEYRDRWYKDYIKRRPWARHYNWLSLRCDFPSGVYYKRGIKNCLTLKDVERFWFRDKAYLMKRPSVDRIDTTQHYTLDNTRFIELDENRRRPKSPVPSKEVTIIQYDKEGNYIKTWRNISKTARILGICKASIFHCLKRRQKMAGGYKWKYTKKK